MAMLRLCILTVISAFLMSVTFHAPVFAQSKVGAEATAHILKPFSIEQVEEIRFGEVSGGRENGTVLITTDGERVTNGGAKTALGSKVSAGVYVVTGEPGAYYEIIAPQSVEAIARSPKKVLQVTDIELATESLNNNSGLGRFDENGKDIIRLGATLIVPARASAGLYASEVALTITY